MDSKYRVSSTDKNDLFVVYHETPLGTRLYSSAATHAQAMAIATRQNVCAALAAINDLIDNSSLLAGDDHTSDEEVLALDKAVLYLCGIVSYDLDAYGAERRIREAKEAAAKPNNESEDAGYRAMAAQLFEDLRDTAVPF